MPRKAKPKAKKGSRKLSELMSKQADPFGAIGNLTPAQRIQRGRDGSKITEDDPRWDPKKHGNRRGQRR